MGSKNNNTKLTMEALAEEAKLNLALARQKMTTVMSDKSEAKSLVPTTSQENSMPFITGASSIIESLYQERPGLHFLSDYDQKLSHKERKAEENITEQDLLEMKAMIREVKSNPSLIYQKFDLPWNEKSNHITSDQKLSGMSSTLPNVRSGAIPHQKTHHQDAIDNSNDHYSPDCVIKATQSRRFSSDFPKPPLSNPCPSKKKQQGSHSFNLP